MGAFAQAENSNEVLTKKGFKILPEAGDIALGVDAAPFLNYAGNFLNGATTNTAPTFGSQGFGIYGKYFLDNDVAVRARLNVHTGRTVYKQTVADDYKTALPEYAGQSPTTVDVMTAGSTAVSLAVGYEMRRGYRRLQGFYGAEFACSFSTSNDAYEWGNPLSEGNQAPTWHNFSTNATSTAGTRTTLVNNGKTFGVGVNGFVGVEYFVASKISVGGQLLLGITGSNTGQTETTTESWDTGTASVIERTVRSRNASTSTAPDHPSVPSGNFAFRTVNTGAIFVMFHF